MLDKKRNKMKFYITQNKYFNNGNNASKEYFSNVNVNENFAYNLINLINTSILSQNLWEELGIISIFTDHVTISIDDIEIIIKSEDLSFNFEKYEVELYNEFSKIRY